MSSMIANSLAVFDCCVYIWYDLQLQVGLSPPQILLHRPRRRLQRQNSFLVSTRLCKDHGIIPVAEKVHADDRQMSLLLCAMSA